MTENIIEVENLNKIYTPSGAKQVHALKNLNLSILKGKTFGLLGHNGAGKSTFINILAQVIRKTSGDVRISGIDLDKNKRLCSYKIGVVLQEIYGDVFLSPWQDLVFLSKLYGLGPQKEYITNVLKSLELYDKRNTPLRSLSGGMKRRLLIAKAMVTRPDILVLDEPTAGVDVQLRQELWGLINVLTKRGVTILLTTHYLEEAQKLCDNIAIIQEGKILINQPKDVLFNEYGYTKIHIKLLSPIQNVPTSLTNISSRISLSKDGYAINIEYKGEYPWNKISKVLSQLSLKDVQIESPTLEDIYLNLLK